MSASGGFGRDAMITMRVVIAQEIQDFLRMPMPGGRLTSDKIGRIVQIEALSHPWVRENKAFKDELVAADKLQGDARWWARLTAVLVALKRAGMLDRRKVPMDEETTDEPTDEGAA